MALTVTYQRVAHALDWLVKVWRDPADNSTVQAVILVDTDGNPTSSGGGGGGDASAANQVLQTALLTTIDADTGALVLKDFSTETTLSALNAKVTACNTGAVVVSSSALPTGAATSANQTTIIGHVDGIEALLTTISGNVDGVETLLGTIDTSLNNIEAASGAVTPAAPAASSVGVASAQILASATYKRIELTNTSTSTISIGIGAAAVLNSGMTLIGTGSTATIEGPFTAAVNAIASGAASNLAIQAWT